MSDITPTKKPLWKRWWFITLVVVFIIGGIANIGKKRAASNSPTIATTTTESTTAPATKPTTKEKEPKSEPISEPDPEPKGLGVSRSKITDVLEDPDIGFSITKGKSINGLPNYSGTSDKIPGGVVQLIGESDNLQKVHVVALFTKNEAQVKLLAVMLIGVSRLVNPDISEWLSKEIGSHDYQSEFTEYKYSKNSKTTFEYMKSGEIPIIILTIEAE